MSREGARLAALVSGLDRAMERHQRGVIQFDARGRVTHAAPVAAELLAAYCGTSPAGSVPPALNAWQRSHSPSLAIDGPRGRLMIRRIDNGSWPMILLEEQRSTIPDLSRLEEMGLTTRQAQVLRLLASGRSTEQVAQALRISAATVRKHLEHIYERLGVESRCQAIARALG